MVRSRVAETLRDQGRVRTFGGIQQEIGQTRSHPNAQRFPRIELEHGELLGARGRRATREASRINRRGVAPKADPAMLWNKLRISVEPNLMLARALWA